MWSYLMHENTWCLFSEIICIYVYYKNIYGSGTRNTLNPKAFLPNRPKVKKLGDCRDFPHVMQISFH